MGIFWVYLGKKSRRNKCCNRVVLGGCCRRVRRPVVPVIKYWHRYWAICDVFLYTVNVQLIYIIKLWLQRFFISQLYFTWESILQQECYSIKKSLKIPKGYIEDEQTTQWLNEKLQKDKQRSTKHAHKTNKQLRQERMICPLSTFIQYL